MIATNIQIQHARLLLALKSTPPSQIQLSNGLLLDIRMGTLEQAAVLHQITDRAYREYRGYLDPPNGSDVETSSDIAKQINEGIILVGSIEGRMVASERLTHATFAPSLARRLAMASPRPRPAPVTMAIWLSNRFIKRAI